MERQRGLLTVSQLNDYLKMLLEGDHVLSSIYVRGEISNFTAHRSGHLYFTLKDPEGQVKAVMFRFETAKLLFRPTDGMKVIAHGRVSLYGPTGQYQLYVDDLQPDGAGALALRYEQLKRQLEGEGLFDPARKKPLPTMPMRIGVITSPTGAAVHDIKHILGRRFPCAQMILFPSAVQGADAPEQLMMGLEFFAATEMVDVIILGRGGGSAEDLWAFNDERLARAVAACPIPVISAVGHESDFTICDFVADCRAPTPSAAAEIAVPDMGELQMHLRSMEARMQSILNQRLQRERRLLDALSQARIFRQPMQILDGAHMRLSQEEQRMDWAMERIAQSKRNALGSIGGRLEALSPLAVLSRGYAVIYKEDKAVLRAKDVLVSDPLKIRFADGVITATAEHVEKVEKHGKKDNEL